jgi:hypothetical protein
LKAFEIDKGLLVKDPSAEPDDEDRSYHIPPSQIEVYKAYQKVGQTYERSNHDRVWDWWLTLVTADPVAKQDIQVKIPQLYRAKEPTGKEWLYYNLEMSGKDWKGNRKDWATLEGVTEGMPEFSYERDASTNKVIPGTTQVLEVKREYTIPFSKAKVEELSKYFRQPLSLILVGQDGRRYSCSLQEFRDMNYDELVNLKTGYTEFMNSRRIRGQK